MVDDPLNLYLGCMHLLTICIFRLCRLVTPLTGEDKYVLLEWYRAIPGGSFTQIKGVKVCNMMMVVMAHPLSPRIWLIIVAVAGGHIPTMC